MQRPSTDEFFTLSANPDFSLPLLMIFLITEVFYPAYFWAKLKW